MNQKDDSTDMMKHIGRKERFVILKEKSVNGDNREKARTTVRRFEEIVRVSLTSEISNRPLWSGMIIMTK